MAITSPLLSSRSKSNLHPCSLTSEVTEDSRKIRPAASNPEISMGKAITTRFPSRRSLGSGVFTSILSRGSRVFSRMRPFRAINLAFAFQIAIKTGAPDAQHLRSPHAVASAHFQHSPYVLLAYVL